MPDKPTIHDYFKAQRKQNAQERRKEWWSEHWIAVAGLVAAVATAAATIVTAAVEVLRFSLGN